MTFVRLLEEQYILIESLPSYACSNARKEEVHNVVIVDLEEHPAKHLLRSQEMLNVCSVVVGAGVTLASLAKR